MMLLPNPIAASTSSQINDVAKALPCLVSAAATLQLTNPTVMAAFLATIAVESHFRCVEEQGNEAYFSKYNNRPDLGNVGKFANSGALYRGRGFMQCTGAANYQHYGQLMGLDLIAHPELMLLPQNAATFAAIYFKEHGCDVWASRGQWRKVRKLVNGGLNGFELFQNYIYNLIDLFYATQGEKPMFGVNVMGMIKAEILKYKDKSGHPLAVDFLDDIEKCLVVIDGFVSKLTPADIEAILALLPASVVAKFAPGELSALAAAIAKLPAELKTAEAAITEAEVDLQEK
jgi:predicted chitinase